MKRKDLMPQKAVAEELGVSITTLWRARQSQIEGFPSPVIMLGAVFWRRADIPKLEEAMLRFKGRSVFERNREAEARVNRLRKARPSIVRPRPRAPSQRDLFDGLAD